MSWSLFFSFLSLSLSLSLFPGDINIVQQLHLMGTEHVTAYVLSHNSLIVTISDVLNDGLSPAIANITAASAMGT